MNHHPIVVFLSTVSKRGTQILVRNIMYTVYRYLYDMNYLAHFHFTVVQKDSCFLRNSFIWSPRAFSIICVCTTAFELS